MSNLLYRDEEYTSAEETSDSSTCRETSRSSSAEESCNASNVEEKPINLYCVKKADSHIYSFEDVQFAYNYCSIDLYQIEKGVNDLVFMDFLKHRLSFKPRSGFGFLDQIIIDNLKRQGITQMRPIQIAALQAVFFANPGSRRPPDFMGVSVTGSGKTHAFLIPIIQKCMDISGKRPFNTKPKPLALIFVHSNTLVENVYQKALKMVKKTGLVVRIIAGKHPFTNDNNFDIGICSIGRFLNHIYPDMPGFKIDLNSVKYVVIDEADKMADTPEFPPLYRTLKEKADFATMLFSATNNASVKNFIDPYNHYAFCYGTPNTVATSVVQKFWHVNSHCTSRVFGVFRSEPVVLPFQTGERPHPFDGIFCLLKKDFMKDKSVLIFVKRTALADCIAQRLTIYGLPTVSVHSNQTFEQRQRFIRFFNDGEVRIMVATNLLTRGTDLQVDYIINYDLPVEYSEYIHRCGRTGRNQQRGRAITCVDFDNHDDYSPAVLRQIALSLEDRNVPDFMAEFVENARKLNTLENED